MTPGSAGCATWWRAGCRSDRRVRPGLQRFRLTPCRTRMAPARPTSWACIRSVGLRSSASVCRSAESPQRIWPELASTAARERRAGTSTDTVAGDPGAGPVGRSRACVCGRDWQASAFILDPDDPRAPHRRLSGRAVLRTRHDAGARRCRPAGGRTCRCAGIAGSSCTSPAAKKAARIPDAAADHAGRREGRYDLVRDGIASDRSDLRELTLDQAAQQVRRIVAGQPRAGAA